MKRQKSRQDIIEDLKLIALRASIELSSPEYEAIRVAIHLIDCRYNLNLENEYQETNSLKE